jgi:hypothetical protein
MLIIFLLEQFVYSCFKKLMERMIIHFSNSSEIDRNFVKMLAFIQIIDQELYDYMANFEENDRFYFGYRWFLLDFKRELKYEDISSVWETIWSSKHLHTNNFSLFIALALILTYKQIIIENNMNYTDMIKFFNEMAEKHNTQQVIELARNLVSKLVSILRNDDNEI